MNSDRPLKVAVCGTGFGRLTHVPGYRSCENVEVAALVGSNYDRTQAYADALKIPIASTSLDDVLGLPNLDLVSVASPVHFHYEHGIAALEAHKHVVVEKPLALNHREAEQMAALAQTRDDLVAVVNTQLRFCPTRQQLKTLVDNNFLGRLYHVSVHSYHDYRSRPWSWKDTRNNGVLRGHASHMIDLVQWLFGPVEQVLGGVLETMIPAKPDRHGTMRPVECEDFASFIVRLANGAVVTFVFSSMAIRPKLRPGYEPAYMRVEAFGEQGSLLLDLDDRLYGCQSTQDQWTKMGTTAPFARIEGIRQRVWDMSFAKLAQTVVSAIRKQSSVEPAATFSDGLAVTRVLDEVLELNHR